MKKQTDLELLKMLVLRVKWTSTSNCSWCGIDPASEFHLPYCPLLEARDRGLIDGSGIETLEEAQTRSKFK